VHVEEFVTPAVEPGAGATVSVTEPEDGADPRGGAESTAVPERTAVAGAEDTSSPTAEREAAAPPADGPAKPSQDETADREAEPGSTPVAAGDSPEAIVERAAPALAELLPRALESGKWGTVRSELKPLEPHMDLVVKGVEGMENARVWIEEWKKADADPNYARQRLERYSAVVRDVLRAMGYEDIPGGIPDISGAGVETADAYCRELFRLRGILVTKIRALAGELKSQLSLLSEGPRPPLASLQAFNGSTGAENLKALEALAQNVGLLEKWLSQDSATPVPLVGIMNGPPQIVPRAVSIRDSLWTGVMSEVERTGASASTWARRIGGDDALEEIPKLRAAVVGRYRAGKRPGATLKWPLEEDLQNLAAVLAAADAFMLKHAAGSRQ
jgi:hypothetical protein